MNNATWFIEMALANRDKARVCRRLKGKGWLASDDELEADARVYFRRARAWVESARRMK